MRRDDWLVRQLPVGMTDDDFLIRFVTIFQQVADTVAHQADTLPHVFDPTVAPAEMVRGMAQWVGVDWVDSTLPERRQREIVMRYAELIPWRGTKRGLTQLLELLTGGPVRVGDTGGVFPKGEAPDKPPHVRIDVESVESMILTTTDRPAPGETFEWNRLDDFIRIIRDELPASVTFSLWVGDERVWPNGRKRAASTGQRPAAPAPGGGQEGAGDA